MKSAYKNITLDRIKDPEFPLRQDLSRESVEDLVQSIKQVGIIEPLVVREKGENYEVVAGHRRLVAAEIAGLTEAPCIIVKANDMETETLKLHENLSRTDINPIEWAEHLGHLKQHYNLSTAKLAEIMGKSEAWISQHLAILDYDTLLLEALKNNLLAFSSARELAQIKDPEKRKVYVNHAIKGGVTPTLAARWRKEANREPMEEQQATTTAQPVNEGPKDAGPQTVCPVCRETIAPEEEVTIKVHASCLPE